MKRLECHSCVCICMGVRLFFIFVMVVVESVYMILVIILYYLRLFYLKKCRMERNEWMKIRHANIHNSFNAGKFHSKIHDYWMPSRKTWPNNRMRVVEIVFKVVVLGAHVDLMKNWLENYFMFLLFNYVCHSISVLS